MELVADRRFLIWSGGYFIAVAILAYMVVDLGIPVSRDIFIASPLFLVITVPLALLQLAVTLSAFAHIFDQKNYWWLIPMFLIGNGGAYLYGFLVATKAQNRNHDREQPFAN